MQWTNMSRLILNSIHLLRQKLEKDHLSVVNVTGTRAKFEPQNFVLLQSGLVIFFYFFHFNQIIDFFE